MCNLVYYGIVDMFKYVIGGFGINFVVSGGSVYIKLLIFDKNGNINIIVGLFIKVNVIFSLVEVILCWNRGVIYNLLDLYLGKVLKIKSLIDIVVLGIEFYEFYFVEVENIFFK